MSEKVVAIEEKRKELQERRKEQYERLAFEGFLQAYLDLPEGIFPIKFINISYGGGSFEFFIRQKDFLPFPLESKVKIRFYITSSSFITSEMTLIHSTFEENVLLGKKTLRYGGSFNQSYPSYKVLSHFIQFLYSFAEESKEAQVEKILTML